MSLEARRDHEVIELFPSTSCEAGIKVPGAGVGDSVRLGYQVNGFVFVLDVTAAETTAGDWLYVYVQTMLDGVNWTDVARFNTAIGDEGAVRRVAQIVSTFEQAEFEVGTALAAGHVRDLFGDEWRVRWVVTKGCSPSAAFTFSVSAIPM